ncbi:type IV secretory system conjugative DNA transfer family protein [Streptomyces prunicolor]|uniref:Type IV secretory system conjugative DNA transfer family protein n=1 Tax=Streptomyces prunicolor TaxID=67348 RepID=A0ABU4FEY7_9ACTN|nr:type IV secretory system conjugative DNA transfer family protein [Streptomyces prunicolor]MDV7219154.1 type IV secretory system conjugative DNA transfer family protein [Streptomyces prunicolor]
MSPPSSQGLQFARLHLPRPLDADAALALVGRLAADRQVAPLVWEIRAEGGLTRHLLGGRPVDIARLGRLLEHFLPDCYLDDSPEHPPARPRMQSAGRLRVRPSYLPLSMDIPETVSRAVLSALAVPLTEDEALVVQVVLGPRILPSVLPAEVPDPSLPLTRLLLTGSRPAGSELRTRLRNRAEHPGFMATIRVGVAASTGKRRSTLLLGVLSGLTVAQGPGTRIRLVRDSTARLNSGRPPWLWPLRLSVPELLGPLAWPLGRNELPGMPPLHPKPLRAATGVHQGERVFALSAAPGDDRRLGISPQDQTFHGVAYGPSGSGKTNVLLHLILADISAGRPVVVLDPKQQLIDAILARVPANQVDRIVELNAFDEHPVGFNPLDVGNRDPDVVVDGILAVFASLFADGYGPRTADIFSAGLRTLARGSCTDQPSTLVDLPRLFTDQAFRRPYVGRAQGDLALAQFWATWDEQGPAAQAAVLAAPMNKLRQFLLRPAVVRMLDQREGRFRLRDTFRANQVVLVPLNEGLVGVGTASLLGSLVIAEVWQAVQERASEPNAHLRPGTVYVDEAPRFVHLPTSLADALAISRSLSVGWFLAAQFRSQLPQELRTAVDINARSKVVFATEADDARELASKLAPELEPQDFMALPRFHAYANLVANGAPSGWGLVRTIPPPPAIADAETIRRAARANYAPVQTAPAPTVANGSAPPQTPATTAQQFGRKRRNRDDAS